MKHKKILKIQNDLGLHGRAAAKIVDLTRQHKSKLFFKKNGHDDVDGSNILSILTLSGAKGTEIEAIAVGDDSEDLLEKLVLLFDTKFGEDK